MRAMGRSEWRVETHQDIPRQLTDGFGLLIEKISIVRDWLPQISYDEYGQSDIALWRLHDLYEANHPTENVRMTATEERVVNFIINSDRPLTADAITQGLRLKNNSHFRNSLSTLVRLRILGRARTGGYIGAS